MADEGRCMFGGIIDAFALFRFHTKLLKQLAKLYSQTNLQITYFLPLAKAKLKKHAIVYIVLH